MKQNSHASDMRWLLEKFAKNHCNLDVFSKYLRLRPNISVVLIENEILYITTTPNKDIRYLSLNIV